MTSTPTPIDPRGPRTNQAVLACALILGLVLGQWLVVPVFAVVLFLGAAFGPKWGPVLRLYGSVIKPRLSPPSELEDPRPPRFAACIGVLFLGASTIAFLLDAAVIGWTLAMIVAALAGLAATTGLCVGCEMYVLAIRLRGGVRIVTVERVEHSNPVRESVDSARRQQGPGLPSVPEALRTGRPMWLVFTTEFCAVCPRVVEQITSQRTDESVLVLDVADNLDLAGVYKVRRAPTVIRADADGVVLARLSGAESVRSELEARRGDAVTVS